MSYNVLVVPEDATHDHYLLKPLLQAMLKAAGKDRAKLKVLADPAVRGVDQAMDDRFLKDVVARYPMVDLFLLCVDRDGDPGREVSLKDRESVAGHVLKPRGHHLLGVAAHQEVEVWCLAGMPDLPRQWQWQQVRAERDSKEQYFGPYAEQRGLHRGPGEGREILGRQAAKSYVSIVARCPELAELQERVKQLP